MTESAPAPLHVAIDGPSGSGKSTVGRQVARALGLEYIDTGAMYRAVALRVLAEADAEAALVRAGEMARQVRIDTTWEGASGTFRIALDGRDVTADVRLAEVARWASRVAAVPEVREALVALQRRRAEGVGVVMEGRDIGTVVLPAARFKFFLDADLSERGRRRRLEEGGDEKRVKAEMRERDDGDAARAASPLRPAGDAIRIDTTHLAADQVVARILATVCGSSSS